MIGENNLRPPDDNADEEFRPEAGEIEPAGGIVNKPPVPERDYEPTEGDQR